MRFVSAALLLVALGCDQQRPARNVLLISVDSLRADRLGVYGSGRETSPTLDRLAREGVLFERALSPTSWTLPSHVTLLSGNRTTRHGTVSQTGGYFTERSGARDEQLLRGTIGVAEKVFLLTVSFTAAPDERERIPPGTTAYVDR